jgi:hemerythrin
LAGNEQIVWDKSFEAGEVAAFPGQEAHKAEHGAFVDQILLLDLVVILAPEGLAWDMFHFPRGWLTNRILALDRQFSTSLPA